MSGPHRPDAIDHATGKAAAPARNFEAHWRAFIERHRKAAEEAKASGRHVYVVKMTLGGTTAGWMGMSGQDGEDVAGAVQIIESAGWRLHDVGYVFQPLRERSHVITDTAQITGQIIGIYTFRLPVGDVVPPTPGANS